jgi:ABC-type transporter lipoprotein component MlaA
MQQVDVLMRDNLVVASVAKPSCVIAIILLFSLTACTTRHSPAESTSLSTASAPTLISNAAVPSVDPYEHYNRNAYRMNDKLDIIMLKPAAKAYKYITPLFFRKGVTNFFSNLSDIPRLANDILQGHFYWTMNDFWRLTLNSGLRGV